MTKITAQEVNNLRKITGAGMMDCKNALVEAEGDVEKSIEILRKKGQKVATKRADRDATEGIVIAKTTENNDFGAVLMLNCETDFVAKNNDFVNFANLIIDLAIAKKPQTVEELLALEVNGLTLDQQITDMIGKTGEKMSVHHYEVLSTPNVFAYNHQGNRLACILGMSETKLDSIAQVGHEIAMQVAAMAPIAVDEAGVSKEIIEKELDIAKDLLRQEGKAEDMIEKIALGKLNRYFKDNTLINQVFVRDGKKTVEQYLKECDADLKVIDFKRLMLGE